MGDLVSIARKLDPRNLSLVLEVNKLSNLMVYVDPKLLIPTFLNFLNRKSVQLYFGPALKQETTA